MNVKTILIALFAFVFVTASVFGQNVAIDYGWRPTPAETEKFVESLPKIYAEQVGELVTEDDNADALLYKALIPCLEKHDLQHWIKDRNGKKVLHAYSQNPVGYCVGNGAASALSVLNAVEVVVKKEPQEFVAMHSSDGMYGLSREAAGMLKQPYDGCSGSGAARALTTFGTLYQLKYGDVDLTKNVPIRARSLGYNGVGDALKVEAAKHKAYTATRVKTAKDGWSLIGNGYPINVCSSIGFAGMQRDSDGICKAWGTWRHSMSVIGRRTAKDGRKLFLIWNSWGDDWCKGPYWNDEPEGSFWIEWSVMDRMLSQGDSFAYGDLDGFKPRSLDDLGTKEYLGAKGETNHDEPNFVRIDGGGLDPRRGSPERTGAATRRTETRLFRPGIDDAVADIRSAWIRACSGSA